jgi:DNA-binding winged helix-turn-helix (wHTH) protein/TolB-like protein/Flp pilus assembly protein TadD
MSELEPQIYEFGDFRVDVPRRLLLRSGEAVPLRPRVFDALLCLVRHHGQVVEKDELMRSIWPDAFVEENNLNQSVSTLRRALGETSGENRYVATVPGRGYRFVAEVRTRSADVPDGEAAQQVPRVPDVSNRRALTGGSAVPVGTRRPELRTWLLPMALLASAIVIVMAASVIWNARQVPSSFRQIAVLPFKPLVVETRDGALELGMAETLIAKLSNIKDVTVRGLGAVRRYGGQEQDPVMAGRALGVEAVLDGQIQRWGNRIRVTTRLVSVSDGKQLWAGQFDEEATDLFAVQDSISERVARELALELTAEEKERLVKRYTNDPQAYELYLRGRFLVSQSKRDSITKAIGFFEEAIRRDPNYALAYVGLADSYDRMPISSDMPSREAFPRAKQAALRALEIDERLVEADTILAWIALWHEWDWEGAGQKFRRALNSNPNDPFAHIGYSHLLSDLGRHDEALREADAALRLDPVSLLTSALKAHFLYQARRYQEGIDTLHESLQLDPTYWIGQLTLGKNYLAAGRVEEALEAFQKAKELAGGASEPIAQIGYTYAVSGRRHEAERAVRELLGISEARYVPPWNVALVYHGLGNTTEALRWLEQAYEERDVHMVFLAVDPKWDALRRDERFVSILKRMKLPSDLSSDAVSSRTGRPQGTAR